MDQVNALRSKFPGARLTHQPAKLKIVLNVQPTARSVQYKVLIKYALHSLPQVWVLSPILKKNDKGDNIPHMYNQERICLFQPKYGEFRATNYLSNTIIPWIALWLYHYEIWQMTGQWEGGGEHPVSTATKKRTK
jgi:hypothetical protein